MATASRASASKSLTRQIESVRRSAGEVAASMPQTLVDGSRELGRRANALVGEAGRSAQRHPWATAGVVAVGVALLGGWLLARRR